ncbi:MAG: WD40 repeat domain-containing protein [Anaerolineae bacterium]|nr:WD40 repeat domain-containing protein [Anaerolineae bacterium]
MASRLFPTLIVLLTSLLAAGCASTSAVTATTSSSRQAEQTPVPTASPTPLEKRITLSDEHSLREGLDWSPDGRYLADVDEGGIVTVYDVGSGEVLHTLEGLATLGSSSINPEVTFSPDSRYVLSGNDEGVIHIWDIQTGILVRRLLGSGASVNGVAWSPNGDLVAVSSGKVVVWDVATGQQRLVLDDANGIETVTFSPDGLLLAAGGNGHAYIWNIADGHLLHTLDVCRFRVFSVAFSPDGTLLATGTEGNSQGEQIKLWDVQTGELATSGEMEQGTRPIIGVEWSPNGRIIASLDWSDTLRLWDADTHQLLYTERQPEFTSAIAWSPDSTQLALSGSSGINIYNLAAYPEVAALIGGSQAASQSTPVPVVIGTPDALPTPTTIPKPLPDQARLMLPAVYSGPLPDGALAQLGLGTVGSIQQSPDQTRVAVSTSVGVTVYNLNPLEVTWVTRTKYRVGVLEWSPDGKSIAVLSDENDSPYTLIVDAQTGAILYELKGHSRPAGSLDWSPDSTQLITGGCDGAAILWDAQAGQMLRRMVRIYDDGTPSDTPDSEYKQHTVAFNVDGTMIAGYFYFGAADYGGPDSLVTLWNTHTGKQTGLLQTNSRISEMAWSSADPSRLAVGLESSQVQIFDVTTQKPVAELETLNETYSLYWSPDGMLLIGIDWRGALIAWDTKTYDESYILEQAGSRLAWAPDGQTYATVGGYYENFPHTTIWEARTGREVTRVDGYVLTGFMKRSSQIVGRDLYSGQLALVDAATGRQLALLGRDLEGTQGIDSLAWSPDGARIAATGTNRSTTKVTVWDIASHKPLYNLSHAEPSGTYAVTWSPDGQIVTTNREHIRIWDGDTGQALEMNIPDIAADDLAFSPDGNLLGGIRESTIYLIEMLSGDKHEIDITHFMDQTRLQNPTNLAWSPNGTRMAVVDADGRIYIVNALTREVILTIEPNVVDGPRGGMSALAWSPDGTEIAASAEKQRIDIYDSSTGMLRRSFGAYLYPNETAIEGYFDSNSISSLSWSPDGKTIAAAYGDSPLVKLGFIYYPRPPRPVILWDAQTGRQLRRFDGHTAEVQVVAFSPDGSMLASGGYDGVTYIWQVP